MVAIPQQATPVIENRMHEQTEKLAAMVASFSVCSCNANGLVVVDAVLCLAQAAAEHSKELYGDIGIAVEGRAEIPDGQ